MGGAGAPIDGAILEDFRDRARTHELVESVRTDRTGGTPSMLVVDFDTDRYPSHVTEASLEIQWYRNDDYNFHYVETHTPDGVWQCRWDRHPNPHTNRAHFHPPPGGHARATLSRTIRTNATQHISSHERSQTSEIGLTTAGRAVSESADHTQMVS